MINKSVKYADIKYSQKLADLFPDAEIWWIYNNKDEWALDDNIDNIEGWKEIARQGRSKVPLPAITTDMILEKLPEWTRVCKHKGWFIDNEFEAPGMNWKDLSLPNALCKMLIWIKKEQP